MSPAACLVRYRIHVYGFVQGVGFRPFVYRLALENGVFGTVSNSVSGVFVEIEGAEEDCSRFIERLKCCPPPAWIAGTELSELAPTGVQDFRIIESDTGGLRSAAILPDLATCPECLREMLDPADRRYMYPFLNCTHCGPRFTIIESIPYDRANTTMRGFKMCDACRREFESPDDRRFHAQPVACPVCGPTLNAPIEQAAQTLRDGQIVALKGIGGFQLLADACNDEAVQRLRNRKRREQKPLAVMFPTLDILRAYCRASDAEARVLTSAAAPIVLLTPIAALAPSVSQRSPWVGAMLPYSPLHHLLLRDFGGPLVATSGNSSEEPIVTDNEDAVGRLSGIADAFVMHDRPIARHADDSVVRIVSGREMVLRRARGYAPAPVRVRRKLPRVLALGAHLKSTVAIAAGENVVVSQHIGDLDIPEARDAFVRTVDELRRLYDFEPDIVACDLHPDYFSSIFSESLGYRTIRVQHHQAHVASCAAENDVEGEYLGVAWDGTGYGLDGMIWGGEFFACNGSEFQRIAHLRPFGLQGGERAIRDCRRSAASVLSDTGARLMTTSAGRLFDAVASITGVGHENAFEGQAAMLLEAVATRGTVRYEIPFENGQLDWRSMIQAIHRDAQTMPAWEIAYAFHEALADAIVCVARRSGFRTVVLSGGVFQNVLLVNMIRSRMEVRTHWRVPPNDGGIALGQAVIAGMRCA
jgi:hydrogenase maturation protein HypF